MTQIPGTPDRTGWLDWPDYLTAIGADGQRLIDLAERGLGPTVPGCPEWTVSELVEHVGHVYLHKVESIRQADKPRPWPPERAADHDHVDFLRLNHAGILAELADRSPEEVRYTWWEPDQTVGFWYRRMAHETAVHRIDAEQAYGEATPVPDALAVDGIDEVLTIMLAESPEEGETTLYPIDATIRVLAGGRDWTLEANGYGVDAYRSGAPGAGAPDTVIDGAPHDLYLWLWGRAPIDALTITGDADHAYALRARIAEAD